MSKWRAYVYDKEAYGEWRSRPVPAWRTWRATLIRWIAGNRSFMVNTAVALEGPILMTDMHMVNSTVWIYNQVTLDERLSCAARTDGYPGLTIGPKELTRDWTPPADS